MLNSKTGSYYVRYYDGITLKNKIIAISFMAIGMLFSAYKVPQIHMRIFLGITFVAVSYHILKLKTLKK